jgi:hypothetical protein
LFCLVFASEGILSNSRLLRFYCRFPSPPLSSCCSQQSLSFFLSFCPRASLASDSLSLSLSLKAVLFSVIFLASSNCDVCPLPGVLIVRCLRLVLHLSLSRSPPAFSFYSSRYFALSLSLSVCQLFFVFPLPLFHSTRKKFCMQQRR